MRRPSFSFAPILVLAAGLWMAVATPAGAHSVVERSSPSPNAALQNAPGQVDVWFSEAVDTTFSSAIVRDASGNRVSSQTVISSDGRRMTAPLADLPSGLYTVRWRVLSAADGHTTSGVLVFTIGAVQQPAEAAGAASPTDPWLAAARWVGFLAAGLLAGAAFFAAWVFRPGLQTMGTTEIRLLGHPIETRLRSLTVVTAIVLVVAALVELALRAAALTDASLIQTVVSGQLWLLLWGTKPGWSTLVRACMALLLLLPASPRGRLLQAVALVWFLIMTGLSALFDGPAALSGSGHLALVVLVGAVYGLASALAVIVLPQVPDFHVPNLTWVTPLAAAVLLMGFTMTSHAWGTGPLAVLIDWLHLIAVAVWIGSLASLLLVLDSCPPADRGRLCRVLVPRISSLAAVSLGVVLVTGIYSSWLHVPSLRAFLITDYGRALLVKLALVVPLIALGALNRFALHPRLQAAGGETTALRRFLLTVTGEVSLALVIVLVVTVLTNVPPARVALATPAEGPIAAPTTLQMAGAAGELRIALTIEPATLGPNELTAVVTDRGRPLDPDARVLIRLVKLDEDLSPITINLAPRGDGRHAASVGELALPGYWQLEVVVRRRGQLDAAAAFPLRLGQSPPPASNPEAMRLFEQVREAAGVLRAWREVQQLTDGAGNVDVTTVEFARPDRLRFRTSGGAEGVIIGTDRYQRTDTTPWEKQVLPKPITLVGPSQYMQDAQAIARGRSEPCEDEPAETCQVLLWRNPSATANFAAWVGTQHHMIHRILMVAPAHYMTLQVTDFNAALRIEPPK